VYGTDFVTVLAGVLAVIILVDVSVLWLTGRQVPELLGQLIFGIFGFYFGRAPFAPRPRPDAAGPAASAPPRGGEPGADGGA
jgi:hypothetical protein